MFNDKNTILYMTVGLPGSGKSTYCQQLRANGVIIHSSDALREELYGDANNQEHNQDLFVELHRRIKKDLIDGHSVVYDATNLSKKRRTAFLAELKSIACQKICLLFLTPFELCCAFNQAREERVVPGYVMDRMYKNFNPPNYREGFNKIELIYNYGGKGKESYTYYNYQVFMFGENGAIHFDQENKHHELTLGQHCIQTMYNVCRNHSDNWRLRIAALIHDNGKIYTKSRFNSKGEEDGDCHYYQHHCVGAYDAFFFMDRDNFDVAISDDDRIYISNLIYYHMMPYTSWKQSEKAMARDRVQMGEEMYQDVIHLHNADNAAH